MARKVCVSHPEIFTISVVVIIIVQLLCNVHFVLYSIFLLTILTNVIFILKFMQINSRGLLCSLCYLPLHHKSPEDFFWHWLIQAVPKKAIKGLCVFCYYNFYCYYYYMWYRDGALTTLASSAQSECTSCRQQGMWAVNRCYNKILQLLSGGAG